MAAMMPKLMFKGFVFSPPNVCQDLGCAAEGHALGGERRARKLFQRIAAFQFQPVALFLPFL